jgi:hypothetical protein
MHGKLATIAGAIFMVLITAQSSSAEVIYPWCAQNSRGGRNCGFVTWEQCRATVSGTGFCVENPFYQRTADPAVRRPLRRSFYSGEPIGPVAPAMARPPVHVAAVSAPASPSWRTDWCYFKGRRGDPQLFLRQQARGCF